MDTKYVTNYVLGGMGNQMFQIATGWSLAKRLGFEYVLCSSNFHVPGGQGNTLPTYFNSLYAKLPVVHNSDTFVKYRPSQFDYYDIHKDLSNSDVSICLEGYFQSEKNFIQHRTEIRSLFSPNEGFKEWLLNNTNLSLELPEIFTDNHDCVFIGVRRGDYLGHNARVHNPCGMVYYQRAMQALPSHKYCIASDDIEWCRERFIGEQYHFFDISQKNDYEQLAVMTLFKKFIISNSSFYWWGSYLSIYGDDIITVAPDKWFSPLHDRDIWKRDYIYRSNMTILSRPVEI